MLTDWKYRFRNLGPIDDAALELGDLTLITGRNNTGKTYLVYTLYGFLRDFNGLVDEVMESWSRKGSLSPAIRHSSKEIADQLLEGRPFELPLTDEALDSDRDDLVRAAAARYSRFHIDNVFNAVRESFSSTVFDAEPGPKPSRYGSLQYSITADRSLSLVRQEDRLHFILRGERRDVRRRGYNILDLLLPDELGSAYAQFLLQGETSTGAGPHCITSARLALSLFHAELETSRRVAIRRLQQDAQTIGFDEDGNRLIGPDSLYRASRYALPIDDEISFIKELPNASRMANGDGEGKPLADIEEMMGGGFTKSDGALYFVPSQDSADRSRIPLHLSSSSAVEMSNPYLYFASGEGMRNRLLIIDEPESHLDPINQIKFARALVRWVNSGVRTLVSTHSDYIVKEINNLIMLSYPFGDRKRLLEELDYREGDALQQKAIRAYHAGGGTLQQCSINAFGIEVPSFEQAIDDLIRVSDRLGSRIMMESDQDA